MISIQAHMRVNERDNLTSPRNKITFNDDMRLAESRWASDFCYIDVWQGMFLRVYDLVHNWQVLRRAYQFWFFCLWYVILNMSLCVTHTHTSNLSNPLAIFFLFLKFRQNEYPPCHPRFWKLQWFHRNQWDKFSGILRHVCSHSKLWYHWESTTVAHLVSAMSGLVSDQILTTKLACVRVTTPWLCWGDMLARCGWLTIVRNFQEHSLETPGRFSHSKNGLCHVMTDN